MATSTPTGYSECGVCFCPYQPQLHIPKILTCGHTFCQVCLEQLCQNSEITCPECKHVCNIPDSQVSSLITNFSLYADLGSCCQECRASPGTEACQHCSQRLCDSCHPFHQQTHVQTTEADLQALSQALDKLQTHTVSRTTLHAISQETDELKKEINRVCDGYNQATEALRSRLLKKADDIKKQTTRAYKDWQQKVFQQEAEVKLCLQNAELDIADFDISLSLSDIQRQCDKLQQQIKVNEAARPSLSKYTLQTRKDMVSDIAESVQIMNPSDTSPHTSSLTCLPTAFSSLSIHHTSPSTSLPATPSSLSSPHTSPQTSLPAAPSNLNSPQTSPPTSLPAAPSSCRPQYSRARLVKEVGSHGFENGKFKGPWGVICTPSGMVVVTDEWNHRFQMFTEDLEHVRSVGRKGTAADEFVCPAGITTDGQGRIFITDTCNSRIQVVNERGRHLSMFGSKGTRVDKYNNPQGITMDQNQRLFICDSGKGTVNMVSADGRYLSTLTETPTLLGLGPAQLQNSPLLISSDSHSRITVTDLYGNLYMFNDKGEHTRTLLCGQPGGFSKAKGTATDAWGTLLVADYKEGCVCVMGEDGQVSCRIGHKGEGPGEIEGPHSIAFTRAGDLIVCDYMNDKIVKYQIPK